MTQTVPAVMTDEGVTAAQLALKADTSAVALKADASTVSALSTSVTTLQTQKLTQGTVAASTSGTSIDFTSIPSWVKRITISFAGVSTSGTATLRVRIGPSGGVETTGYVGSSVGVLNGVGFVVTNHSAGFELYDGTAANVTRSGAYVLTLIDAATNTWALHGSIGESASARYDAIAGHKALAGALSIVRITTFNGTDTFDAGSINILYE